MMGLAFRFLTGELKDQTIALKAGMRLGRSRGDIAIQDAKASSDHAVIQQRPDGPLILVDKQSKNGTRVKGQRINSVELSPGLTLQIGDTFFEVIQWPPVAKSQDDQIVIPEEEITPSSPVEIPKVDLNSEPVIRPARTTLVQMPKDDLPSVDVPVAQTIQMEPEPRTWSEILETFSVQALDKVSNRPRPIVPLNPALTFSFFRGLQAETVWTLGYGPRRAGSGSLDLPILEPDAPEICFEILPTPDGVTFKTNYPDLVLLNGQSIGSQVLKAGDIIRIVNTEIEVDVEK